MFTPGPLQLLILLVIATVFLANANFRSSYDQTRTVLHRYFRIPLPSRSTLQLTIAAAGVIYLVFLILLQL